MKQLRLWNTPEDLQIYFVIDRGQDPFWEDLASKYDVKLVYTDTLPCTAHHAMFKAKYAGDTAFRDGYWKFVTERFFYIEEVMISFSLGPSIAMEYDVLVYTPIKDLMPLLGKYTQSIALVRDNETRAHPGCMYLPSVGALEHLNHYIACMLQSKLSDMELLHVYGEFYPERVSYLPVISHKRNATKFIRKSSDGQHSMAAPLFLSSGYEVLGGLFDSAVVGQWVGGVDPRNTGGADSIHYVNESALYSMREMPFEWKKVGGLWQPHLDASPLITIHVHSKALECLLSDRPEMPCADYDPTALLKSLPN